RFKPDIFIFTHPFPVVGYRQSLKVPAWTIITDYSFHPIWYNPKIRGYFVANTETQEQLCKTNYPMDRVFDTGIPLKKSFSNTKNIDRSHTKSDNHKPLILIMGGGLGIGGLKEIVDELDKLDYPFESIVLTGKNHSLYQDMISSFKKNKTLRWSVLQFSNDIHLLMRKASLLISKAGAITLTEALVSNLPTIIYKPIPGHEEENARFACKQEWAIWAKNSTDLILTTESLLSSPEKLARMRQKSAQFSKPFSTRNITRIITNEVALPMEKSL
ncbi:MGDG synthase family glycosyltransferase, partial [Anaerosolibacter sp.]|uniref:MGDG synthase family glycosyltransferase n=1 Tax=Anaerosolibacter sp. TaxID=1872527 RepID=UPI0039EE5F83